VILVSGLRLTFVALRESQERLAALVAELQHRTRNLMSVVGMVADRTLRASETFDDFKASFQDRIGVLGRAQGLLFRTQGPAGSPSTN
jgi:two-component sensor histidine kinase